MKGGYREFDAGAARGGDGGGGRATGGRWGGAAQALESTTARTRRAED
jgi:hypothetical protein